MDKLVENIVDGYKVVRMRNGSLGPVISPMPIKYVLHEWITRKLFGLKNGPYTYFNDIEKANEFIRDILFPGDYNDLELWYIHAEKDNTGVEPIVHPELLFYRSLYSGKSKPLIKHLPSGTCITNKFMLVKKVINS